MAKQHKYKGFIIENVPYRSEPRWFIEMENQKDDNNLKTYPKRTLKEAKEYIDAIIRKIS